MALVLLGTPVVESLTFLGFTLVSALHEIANKHLISAAFAPVASSCCCVSQSALTGRVFQRGLAIGAVGSRRGA